MIKDNGGQVYPSHPPTIDPVSGSLHFGAEGMTLRQHYAISVLPAIVIMNSLDYAKYTPLVQSRKRVERAFQYADIMIDVEKREAESK